MRKFLVLALAVLVVLGMSAVGMAQNNDADVDQEGGYQSSVVTQTGNDNEADIYQFTDNDGAQGSNVSQNGSNNMVDVSQFQTGGGGNQYNSATATQWGSDNIIIQSTNAPGYNGGQNVTAWQDGTLNEAEQYIYGGYTNSLYSNQIGEENYVYQELDGSHIHADVYQDGNFNEAYQYVSGLNHGSIMIDQDGESNYALQDVSGSAWSTNTTAHIFQTGDNNYGEQTINGSNNYALIDQDGNDNNAVSTQTGNNHSSDISQLGDNNSAVVTQN